MDTKFSDDTRGRISGELGKTRFEDRLVGRGLFAGGKGARFEIGYRSDDVGPFGVGRSRLLLQCRIDKMRQKRRKLEDEGLVFDFGVGWLLLGRSCRLYGVNNVTRKWNGREIQ